MQSCFKTKTIVIWSVILTVLVFLTAVLTSEMAYLTNDDGGIQSALSGATTGEPYPYHQFISVILSFPIAGLYKLFPDIQWWYIWSMLAMAVGIFLVQYCLLRVASNGNHSVIATFGLLAFLDIGFFVYPIANVSFTIVPAVLGTGIVAGLLWLAEKDVVKHKIWIYLGIVIGYVLLFAHRRQTGLAILCYILLAFLYYYVSKSENLKQVAMKFIGTASVFLLITASLTCFNSTIQNNHNGGGFVAFNSARSQFMDYPHDTYEENPELYEKVGWDEDTYNLASKWCFLNENITTENLSYISENSQYTTAATNVSNLVNKIYKDPLCRSIFLLFAVSIIIAGYILAVSFDSKTLLFLLMNNGGTAILILYQIFTGRTMYRSIIILLLPAVVINLMLSMKKDVNGKSLVTFRITLCLLGLICVIPILSATFNQERKTYVIGEKDKYHTVNEYLLDHQKEIYVHETTGITDNIVPELYSNRMFNYLSYGGSNWNSAIFYDKLHVNGLYKLNEETLKIDNVHFVSKTNTMDESYYDNGSDAFAMLYRKLQEDCGALGFVQEDVITDGAYVYHFVFDENLKDYDFYYDIDNGYTIEIHN